MVVSSRRPSAVVVALVLAACGWRSHSDIECPEGQHHADPDGRGDRCISDASTCERTDDCRAATDGCCEVSCVDVAGDGVYACELECLGVQCDQRSCEPGTHCEEMGECASACVPDDAECPPEFVAADPDGDGVFVCARVDSTCFSDAACLSDDPCCTGWCDDQGEGLYGCSMVCDEADGGEERPEPG